ncbi:MAG: DUF1572 family protein [Planctomycetota bacterium]
MSRYTDPALAAFLPSTRQVFERQRCFAEHCAGQLDDGKFFATLAPGLNSVGQTMQHMAGNMKSRWTGFLASDGEKPWRDREAEFAEPTGNVGDARAAIMSAWAEGWRLLNLALDDAEAADAAARVHIRGVPHSIEMAIVRQIDHYGYHVGQIATVARGLVGNDRWRWFTVAPGGTAAFNRSIGYAAGDASPPA